MTERKALYLHEGKKVRVGNLSLSGEVIRIEKAGLVRVKLDNGMTWIGPLKELLEDDN